MRETKGKYFVYRKCFILGQHAKNYVFLRKLKIPEKIANVLYSPLNKICNGWQNMQRMANAAAK